MKTFRQEFDLWLLALLGLGVCCDSARAQVIFEDQFENTCGIVVYSESFTLGNGAAWPSAWSVLGGVALADIQSSGARLRPTPSSYALARMGASVATRDVEVRFRLRMEDAATQGVGFYVRQNGGYLSQSMPTGQGYAVFIEGTFRNVPGIGLWKEQNGNEIEVAHSMGLAGPSNNSEYQVRFQTQQNNASSTLMRAKFWPVAEAEPVDWQVSVSDNTPVLQNLTGDIAIDSWSVLQAIGSITAHTFVDEIEIIPLCASGR